MARPLRVEYANALYHVTVRGNRRTDIFLDDDDQHEWLALVGRTAARYQWIVYAYCLMANHFHLLVQTLQANLARGMQYLNGVYTQRFNRRHDRCGHVLQGRYHAVVVEEEAYLMEVARYILLNPVRAGLVMDASSWRWSSYGATCEPWTAPPWLGAAHLLQRFSNQPLEAIWEFQRFVDAGISARAPWEDLRHGILLGDAAFIAATQARMRAARRGDIEIPRAQRRQASPSLGELFTGASDVPKAVVAAYRSGDFTMRQIADHLGVHYSTISRWIARNGWVDLED